MEERLRFCESCRAPIGAWALFCESCGHRQATVPERPRSGASPLEVAPGRPASKEAPDALPEAPSIHAVDPRIVVRDMFRAQTALIESTTGGALALESELGSFLARLHRASDASDGTERRRALDALSEVLSDVEHRWEELQRHYNRESERLEEEAEEKSTTLDIDAWITPDDRTAVESGHATLEGKLSDVARMIEECGGALRAAVRRADSRFLGMPASSPATVVGIVASGILLWGLSAYILAEKTALGWSEVLRMQAPAAAAVLLLAGLLRARR